MATAGYIIPVSQQIKRGFHAIRRTTEGLVYYTKVDLDKTDVIDVEGGNPSDKSVSRQLPTTSSYTREALSLQAGATEYFTGDGSTLAFTLTGIVLDGTRLTIFVNNIEQGLDVEYAYTLPTITFKIAPASGTQIAVGKREKKYFNNTTDFYQQYIMKQGESTFFIDDDGYLVKRDNLGKGLIEIATDDFSTAEASLYPVAATTYQDAV